MRCGRKAVEGGGNNRKGYLSPLSVYGLVDSNAFSFGIFDRSIGGRENPESGKVFLDLNELALEERKL
jgi:hypothetical protein